MEQENLIPPDDWAKIDPQLLEGEYTTISGLLMRAGKLKSDAKREVSLAKQSKNEAETTLEETEALLYLKFRNDEALSTLDSKDRIKFPSEGTISAAIRGDAQWTEAQENVHACELEIIDAQHTYDRCWEAMESLKAKKEMLVSIGADRRAELKGLT